MVGVGFPYLAVKPFSFLKARVYCYAWDDPCVLGEVLP